MRSPHTQNIRTPTYLPSSLKRDNNYQQDNKEPCVMKKINNYNFKLSDIIGRGAFSTVYKGNQQTTEQVVAIKVVELNKIQSSALRKLLYSQVEILKSINHPNVLKCYDVYFSSNNCYIVTEYCNGGDLRSIIAKQGALKQESSRKIVLGIYQGLKYLSQESIIHRDIKAANVFIKDGQPKIADFGFAKRSTQTFKDVNIGSPLCMSPQGLIQNIYGAKTDVWAFGILLYQMFHGKTPFGYCKTQQQLKSTVSKSIKSEMLNHYLPEDLRQLILDCLEVKQQYRISMKQINFSQYITRIKQSLQTNNLLISQVQQYRVNGYDSSLVSTQVPIQTQRTRKFDNKIDIFESQNSFQESKLRKDKSTYIKKTSQFSLKYKSPRESKLQSKFKTSENKFNYVQSSFNIGKLRNKEEKSEASLDLYDRKLTIMSAKKEKRLNSTISNFKTLKDPSLPKVWSPRTYLINNLNNFNDILSLLHYCRVLFKTIKLCQRFTFRKLDYLGSWLFKILDEIDSNIKQIIKPSYKILQLKQIILQYSDKYRSELPFSYKTNLNITIILQIIAQILTELQSAMDEDAILATSYLVFFYDLTQFMSKSTLIGNHQLFTEENQIEQFLEAKEKIKGKEKN